MEQLKCKNCRAKIDPDEIAFGVVRCKYCGYTFTWLKKEVEQSVMIDLQVGEDELAACDFNKAYAAYKRAADADKSEPEAYFGMALAENRVQYLKDTVKDRLQPICHEVGGRKFSENPNYKKALSLATPEQKIIYESRAQEIDYIQAEFAALAQSGAKYDCFICVKVTKDDGKHTEDSFAAGQLYQKLKEDGYHPFYSEEEIGNRRGADYEAMILYALYTSPCMLLVCFDEEYLKTKWVKNEYTRFVALRSDDKEKKDEPKIALVYKNEEPRRLSGALSKVLPVNYDGAYAYSQICDFVSSFAGKTEEVKKRGNRKVIAIAASAVATIGLVGGGIALALGKDDGTSSGGGNLPPPVLEVEYALSANGELTGVTLNGNKNVTVPSEIEGVQVLSISADTFAGNKEIEELTLPDSVTSIPAQAFKGCSALKKVELPETLLTLGEDAFVNCSSLTELVLPSQANYQAEDLLAGCSALTSLTVSFNDEQTTFGALFGTEYFSGSTLTVQKTDSYYLPNTLKTVTVTGSQLPEYAFYRCSNLTTVNLSEQILSVGESTFQDCSSLTAVTVSQSLTDVGANAFSGCSSLRAITLPQTIEGVGDRAFADCSSLVKAEILGEPTLGQTLFTGCSALTEATLPFTAQPLVLYFGTDEFENSVAVQEFARAATYYLPSDLTKLTTVGESVVEKAFANSSKLSQIIFDPTLSQVGAYAFANCTALTEANFNDLASLGDYAFYNCGVLTSVCFADVDTLGVDAFDGCSALAQATINSSDDWATATYGTAKSNPCYYGGKAHTADGLLTELTLSDTVTAISAYAFYNCSELVKANFSENVTTFGAEAFYGCSGLQTVNVASISAWSEATFADETSNPVFMSGDISQNNQTLTEIEITTQTVSSYAFRGALCLEKLVLGENVKTLSKNAFSKLENLTNLTLRSTELSDFEENHEVFTELSKTSKSLALTVSAGVQRIPARMLSSLAGEEGYLSSVTFEENSALKSVGVKAFGFTGALKELNLPTSLESVEEGAFSGVYGLENISIPFLGTTPSHSGATSDYFGVIFGQTAYKDSQAIYQIEDQELVYHIPKTLQKITLKQEALFENAFRNVVTATEIKLENQPTEIPQKTFWGCSKLEKVLGVESVKYIRARAFEACSLFDDFKAFTSLEEIGEYAFEDCYSMTEAHFPDSMTKVEKGAFARTSLQKISINFVGREAGGEPSEATLFGYIFGDVLSGDSTQVTQYYEPSSTAFTFSIPNSLKWVQVRGESIPYGAFYNCNMIEEVEILDTVTEIGNNAFMYVKNLKKVTFPYVFSGKFKSVFYSAQEVHITGGTLPYQAFYQNTALQKVTLDEDVGITDDEYSYTFYQCSSLKQINLPAAWTRVGGYAFYGCSSLESVTLPEGLEVLGSYAFYNCKLITDIKIPAKVTDIGMSTFQSCAALENVDTSEANAITNVGSYAFDGCQALTQMVLPDTVQTIGAYAFRNCSALTKVNVPKSVTSVGQSAYYNAGMVEELVWAAENCADFNSYTHNTFLGFGANSANGLTLRFTNTVKRVPSCMFYFSSDITNLPKISKIIFDENSSLEQLGEYVVFGVVSEIEELRLPDSVFKMQEYGEAFYGFTIKNCYLPSVESWSKSTHLTYTGTNILTRAENLYIEGNLFTESSELVIPSTVERISPYAFVNLKKLRNLTLSEGVKEIGEKAFYGTAITSMTVPSTLTDVETDVFQALEYSSIKVSIADIDAWAEMNFSNAGANPLRFSNAQLLLNGTLVTSFTPTSAETIGAYAFCGYRKLVSVSLPACVKEIGASAFESCTQLQTVLFSEGLTSIADKAFYSCSALASVALPETALDLGDTVFSGCSKLSQITFPSELQKIPGGFLANCIELKNVTLPQTLTEIRSSAFKGCTALTRIEIPQTAVLIGESAFEGCSELTNVTGMVGLEQLSDRAFYGCTKLSAFELPEGLTSIGASALANCTALTSLEIGENISSIGDSAFAGMSELKEVLWRVTALPNLRYASYIFEGAGTSSTMIVTFAENVETIPSYLFYNRTNKAEIALVWGEKLTKVNNQAFYGETVASVTVPSLADWYEIEFDGSNANPLNFSARLVIDGETVVSLDELSGVTVKKYAFYGYQYLEKLSVENTTTVDKQAFENCSNLSSVYWNASSLPADALVGAGASNTNLTLEIGADVTQISNNYAKNLTGLYEVKFEAGGAITEIGSSAFSGCSALEKFTAPEALEKINYFAFGNCVLLNNLVFSEKVTTLSGSVFSGCTALESLVFEADKISGVNSTTFQNTLYRTNGITAGNGVFYFYDKILDFDSALLPATLTIPEGITGFSGTTFVNQTVLESVIFPQSFLEICDNAFSGCGLTSVEFNSALQTIGANAFKGSAFTEITLPASLASINANAFEGCASLETVHFAEGLTNIGAKAFYNCTKLTGAVLPESLESIGDYAFGYCGTLATFEMKNPETTLGSNVFYGTQFLSSATVDGFLYIGTVLAWADKSIVKGDVVVREGTTSIAGSAFKSCQSLSTVTLPSSVKKIGNEAFRSCTLLKSIIFSGENSIEEIGEYAFTSTKITEFSLPEGIQKIEKYAFSSCTSLTSLTLPQSVIELGEGALVGCTSLSELELPQSLEIIGERALSNTGLVELVIPASVKEISVQAFSNNKKLTKTNLPNTTYLETYNSYGTLQSNAAFNGCTALTDVTLDENIEALPNSIFYGCSALTTISLPLALTEIGNAAFANCAALTDIGGIPQSVTTIGSQAFYGCVLLADITIPAGLTKLGSSAFYNCDGLTEITLPATLQTLSSEAFYNCDNLAKVTIPEGLKTIESYAFYGCAITDLTLPQSLTFIGTYALGGNDFTTIEIPSGLRYLSNDLFVNCTSLTEITIPENISTIEEYVFSGCTSLTKVTMKGVTYIDRYAFRECSALTDIDFGDKLTTIDSYAFYKCYGLKKLYFPKSLTKIYRYAFQNCNSLGGRNSIVFEDTTGWFYYGIGWLSFDVTDSWQTYLKISGDYGLEKNVY
ncbi:MAG: leucine-rich repeat protein [Clostridia bacterium]|nr:leucine-rich repeat protein [Clostridia bacterium]